MHLFFWDVYPAVDISRGASEHSQSANIINFSWIINRFTLLAEVSLRSAGLPAVLELPGVSWGVLKAVSQAACLAARCSWSASPGVLCLGAGWGCL